MSQERTYFYNNDRAQEYPVTLTIEDGKVTNIKYQNISAFIDPAKPLSKYVRDNDLTISFFPKTASSARGKRSKKQRKSVRKLRRKNASRRK